MMRNVCLFVLLLIECCSPANAQPVDMLDSLRLRAGQWLTGEITSFNKKAVYLADGRIVMHRVVAEIRTRRDPLAAEFTSMFPKCVTSREAGYWILRPDTGCIDLQVPPSGRLFSGSGIFLNLTTARAGVIEARLHVEPGPDGWLFLELGGAYGRATSDGLRDIMGVSGIIRSVIEYEAWLLFIGMGVQYRVGAGHLELAADVGKRSLSSSLAGRQGSAADFAQLSSDVAFATLRYVHGFATSPLMVCAGIRYYIIDTPIDAETQRFAVSVGIGYRF